MPYSRTLVDRVRRIVAARRGRDEKKMFGGVGFLLHGNLLVGVWEQSLIVRLGTEQARAALRQPHVKPFDITGRPLKGWAMVEPEGIDDDEQLQRWIEAAEEFVATLPAK
jgi:TfoX/Sxy family transcriptional regulator of competence genes